MLRSKLNAERAVPSGNEHQNSPALNLYLACLNQLQQVKERLERLSPRSYLRLKYRPARFSWEALMLNISIQREVRKKTAASDVWHISPKCSRWPMSTYISLLSLPERADVCTECIARERAANLQDTDTDHPPNVAWMPLVKS